MQSAKYLADQHWRWIMIVGFCQFCAKKVPLELEILEEPVEMNGQLVDSRAELVEHAGTDGATCPGSGEPPVGLVEEAEDESDAPIPMGDEAPHLDGRPLFTDLLLTA